MLTRRTIEAKKRLSDETWLFRPNYETPFGTPKSMQNRYFAEKPVQGVVFLLSFVALAAFLPFSVQIWVIFRETLMFFFCDLCCISFSFSQPRHPHDTPYFTMYNAIFDFVVSQDFLQTT